LGIDEITYGADDLPDLPHLLTDWGLERWSTRQQLTASCSNASTAAASSWRRQRDPALPPAMEAGPTLREVVWGVESATDLALLALPRHRNGAQFFAASRGPGNGRIGCTDPNGLAVRFQVTRKHDVEVELRADEHMVARARINQRSPAYERAEPIEVGHVVFFVKDVQACERLLLRPLRLRAAPTATRAAAPSCAAPTSAATTTCSCCRRRTVKRGLNHVAFTVRDIHEVFGGGMHISRQGWDTQLGPGRHPVSSAYFWYFQQPGRRPDRVLRRRRPARPSDWEPREFEPGPTVFAEWAIDGGLDGHTRRQKQRRSAQGRLHHRKANNRT
jgi:hypothetical protein